MRDWPETASERCNVLCEGPSIQDLDLEDLLDGPVVAVNHTLSLVTKGVPIDVWATVDDPKNLWEWAQPYLEPETKLFSTENNLLVWTELLGNEPERLYVWEPTYMEGFMDDEGKAPLLPTLSMVFPWLFKVGVRHVRLFGVDMRGSSSHLHQAIPYSDDEDDGWDLRWDVERRLLAVTMRKFRELGGRIERWGTPKRTRLASVSF